MKLPHVQMPLLDELAEVDTVISRAIAAGNPLVAAEYGNYLHRTAFLKGVSLAKLLSSLRSNWRLFQVAGIQEEFEDFVEAHFLNLSRTTATRYADMYESVFERSGISEQLRNQLAVKPIGSLLLLTAAVREGDIGEEELQEAVLQDERGIREIVRRARGEVTKSSKAIYAKIVTRNNTHFGPPGTLVVFQEGMWEVLGYLNPNTKNKFTGQFLERMKSRLGIGEL